MNIPSYLSGAIFMKAQRTLRSRVVNSLARHDLSPTAWSFLGAIMNAPDGARPVSLAHSLGIKAPLITVLADDFIKRGLVRRVPHPTDGRAKIITATAEGKRFVKLVENDVNQALSQLLEGLTNQDLEAYRKVLEVIITNGQK